MPIELGIWRLGDSLKRVNTSSIESEKKLEEILVRDLSILTPGLMLIGRQVSTSFGKFIDLLAMDIDGNLVVIELKRDRTPREVVAQTLDYGSWVKELSFEEIKMIYSDKHEGNEFEKGFADIFGSESTPEKLNQSHRLIVVASELDPATERIIDYLSDGFGVPINAVFFRYFKDGASEYLTRTWLIDPDEAEAKASKSAGRKTAEPWNGRDFYVSFGDDGSGRRWEDAREYNFISGGGGKWYSQTLSLLFPGSRVFVNIPQTGYVAVGTVRDVAVPIKDFKVQLNGAEVSLLRAPLKGPGIAKTADDPERSEYVVRVEWQKAVPKEDAYWEKGLFAIQHTACRMRSAFTIERLTKHFKLDA